MTIPPLKISTHYDRTRWLEWLESMQKDVVYIFGILKKRWRILKFGIRSHGVNVADDMENVLCLV